MRAAIKVLMPMGGGGVQYGEEQTLTLQPDGTAGVDTEIRSDTATGNYGTANIVHIGEYNSGISVRRTLIKFDLSSLAANVLVTSATLKLYCLSDFANNASIVRAYRLLRAWVETQATWNIYSTGNNWATAGGFGAADCEQTDIGSISLSASEATPAFKEITLTPSGVQGWIAGTLANNGLLLKPDTETDNLYQYASSDHLTANIRPILEVRYRVPL